MWLSEQILYRIAKLLYKGQAAHSREMKSALATRDAYNAYRHSTLGRIVDVARRYGVDLGGKVLLDLGCSDGAITVGYLNHGADRVIGIDIDAAGIDQARQQHASHDAEFHVSDTSTLPLPDNHVDVIISYDVFEHVSNPLAILTECRRILRPEGKMLIGTWGWHHPYAPHLWSTMPVPWVHVLFSEKTILRTCRKVYHSAWYIPNMHDIDECGNKKKHKYLHDAISPDYVNKFLIRDFERAFTKSGLDYKVYPQPFGSRYARWTKWLLRAPWIREFITGYIWVVLIKHGDESASFKRDESSSIPSANRLSRSQCCRVEAL